MFSRVEGWKTRTSVLAMYSIKTVCNRVAVAGFVPCTQLCCTAVRLFVITGTRKAAG